MAIETVSEWLEAEGIVPVEGPGAIADVARIRTLLIAAAREARSVSYSELLGELGYRFSRPKMRALCRTLDAVDRQAAAADEPELAVLVVRESDRLPGQGWWTGAAETRGYRGAWTGAEAAAFVRAIQQRSFDHWRADAAAHPR
jgi:hypothetical protein